MAPLGAPEISDDKITQAFSNPVAAKPLRELACGKKTAIVAVDDITRPTPTDRILPHVINEITAGGIKPSNIRILIGSGAHRPMTHEEITKKLTPAIANHYECITHDFTGSDIRRVGWVKGGPVYINRHFLQADLRVCVGSVIPHNQTGFSGGAKMVVPGLSGHLTISHFHGALHQRLAGQLGATPGIQDCRGWSEHVARHIGVHSVVCAVVNPRRKLAGLFVGDLVAAHRQAAVFATRVGKTTVPSGLANKADAVVVNSYPLDSDPIQTGKSVDIAKRMPAKFIIAINAASDGILYHGMGMGCGLNISRLLGNIPSVIAHPNNVVTCLRSLIQTIARPKLAARLCYFSLNALSYERFQEHQGKLNPNLDTSIVQNPELMLYSPRFPAWGFTRRFPKGCLFRQWSDIPEMIERHCVAPPNILVFPCAPLQIVEIN